jgi:DNA repair protein RecO (recombination protein O)
MPFFSTPAILLRRIPHGDYDLIATFLSEKKGKITLIAKNAKKSRKRFGGILEPFSKLNLVCAFTKNRSLGVLQEASISQLFPSIPGNIIKTAYASYWAEIIYIWCEEGKALPKLYDLFCHCLRLLDTKEFSEAGASIIFQTRFLCLSGLSPNLTHCASCKKTIDDLGSQRLIFELAKGGLVCQGCSTIHSGKESISKGTVKLLLWIIENELGNLKRLKFNRLSIDEGLKLMEMFVPYHLGKEPKSLKFLRGIR